jgi:hypothetical protein
MEIVINKLLICSNHSWQIRVSYVSHSNQIAILLLSLPYKLEFAFKLTIYGYSLAHNNESIISENYRFGSAFRAFRFMFIVLIIFMAINVEIITMF